MAAMKLSDSTFTVNGIEVPFRLFTPKNAKADWAVLWLQGFRSTIEGHTEGVIRMAKQSGTTFAMINYAGHGDHPVELPEASREQQLNEVLAAYDKLTKIGFSKIIVIGGSFGSYMAALLVAERHVAGLVLRCPAIYEDDEFTLPFKETLSAKSRETMDLWRENVTPQTPSKAFAAVKAYRGDTYVIEHEKDTVINRSIPRSYFALAQHGNYLLIRGLDHTPKLMPNPEHFYDLIEAWLVTMVNNLEKAQEA